MVLREALAPHENSRVGVGAVRVLLPLHAFVRIRLEVPEVPPHLRQTLLKLTSLQRKRIHERVLVSARRVHFRVRRCSRRPGCCTQSCKNWLFVHAARHFLRVVFTDLRNHLRQLSGLFVLERVGLHLQRTAGGKLDVLCAVEHGAKPGDRVVVVHIPPRVPYHVALRRLRVRVHVEGDILGQAARLHDALLRMLAAAPEQPRGLALEIADLFSAVVEEAEAEPVVAPFLLLLLSLLLLLRQRFHAVALLGEVRVNPGEVALVQVFDRAELLAVLLRVGEFLEGSWRHFLAFLVVRGGGGGGRGHRFQHVARQVEAVFLQHRRAHVIATICFCTFRQRRRYCRTPTALALSSETQVPLRLDEPRFLLEYRLEIRDEVRAENFRGFVVAAHHAGPERRHLFRLRRQVNHLFVVENRHAVRLVLGSEAKSRQLQRFPLFVRESEAVFLQPPLPCWLHHLLGHYQAGSLRRRRSYRALMVSFFLVVRLVLFLASRGRDRL
mmetsp:Transcript_28238/g.71680  ORF Transcript_28238/g.71680 Transcript_28238/m.71680 type:complete len:497 (+) Transcript_28238:2119-3609(+)